MVTLEMELIMNTRYGIPAALLTICTVAFGGPAGPVATAQPPALQPPAVAQALPAAPRLPATQAPATDPGIVKTPPRVGDAQVIERPPRDVDPGMLIPPPADATRGSAPGTGTRPLRPRPPDSSRQGDCKGSSPPCKQDPAR